MYLSLSSEQLGNRTLVVGPFPNETTRSQWRDDFFEALENAHDQIGPTAELTASIRNTEELFNQNTSIAQLYPIEDVVGQIIEGAS